MGRPPDKNSVFDLLVRDHERHIASGLSADETRMLLALLEKVRVSVRSL